MKRICIISLISGLAYEYGLAWPWVDKPGAFTFSLLGGYVKSAEKFGSGKILGKNEMPIVTAPDSLSTDTFLTMAFQSPELHGVMPSAAESVEDVEKKALRGCGGGLDCIPAYSYPQVLPVSRASGPRDNDLVLGAYVNGRARAYPISTLWQHEIANDTLGGTNITVNYCPLTGTGLNFKGRLKDGTPVTFGVSGLLNNNNLILYDRQTLSYWPQMLFTAAWGERKNEQITLLPVMEITWKAWKKLFPHSTVVSSSLSGMYPYGNYLTDHNDILFPQKVDSRLNSKDLVMGVIGKAKVKVYPFKNMRPVDVINDVIDGVPILVLFSKEAQSAQVFERLKKDGDPASFTLANSEDTILPEVVSSNGGGRWNFAGMDISARMEKTHLKPVVTAFKGFWLSWGSYYNVSEIYGE